MPPNTKKKFEVKSAVKKSKTTGLGCTEYERAALLIVVFDISFNKPNWVMGIIFDKRKTTKTECERLYGTFK